MADSVLSICWNEHASELATVYKRLLESNFLVDCTISAEGQNLKAHRLVLSASSPYFQELFGKEIGKHPFVILLDASFETLKAVIDFVYQGETQIPEGNLKSFLTLAQSLQIKGLNVSIQDYEIHCSNCTVENVAEDPIGKNHLTCEVEGINASQEDSSANNALKPPHHSGGYTDALHTNCSVPLKESNVLCDEVRSTSVMTPLQEHWRPEGCDVSTAMEITVKNEPVCSEFSEEINEKLDNIKSEKLVLEDFTSNLDGRTGGCGEEDLNLLSSRDVAEESGSLLPVVLGPKDEQLSDEASEEPIDYPDESGNGTNERMEEKGPAYGEQSLGRCLRAEGLPLENDLATPQQSGVRLWGRGTRESTAPLLLPEGQGEEPVPSAKGRKALASSNSLARLKPSHHRKHSCDVCGATFIQRCHLVAHSRTHTGERPYRCDVCGKLFVQSGTLSKHYRTHTGERPFHCDVCGKRFAESGTLSRHYRTHTGERPFTCDVCGVSFTQQGNLIVHSRTHTGERPFVCNECGVSFTQRCHLVVHSRTHTGERQFTCDVCGVSFAHRSRLVTHIRKHTGERLFRCEVCGKRFANSGTLSNHYHTHTERLFSCEVCGVSFTRRALLVAHKRTHTGGRP